MTTQTEMNVETAIEQAQQAGVDAEQASITVLSEAESFKITTDVEYGQSGELLKQIKAHQKELDLVRRSMTRPIDDAKSRVMGFFKPATERLEKAEAAIKNAMIAFNRKREQERREAQARIDEAARKERERLAKLAEKQRESGKQERAAVTEQRAANVQPVEVADAAPPKVEGVAMRTTWKAEVRDLAALVRSVAAGEHGIELLQPNMQVLNVLARAQKEELSIPGVAAVSEEGIAAQG